MGAIRIREARAVDLVKFTRKSVPLKYVGVVAEDVTTGELIGAGAIVQGVKDRLYVCLDITPRLRAMPKLMHRVGSILVKAGREVCGSDLYSVSAAKEPTSERWLRRLGFRPTEEMLGRDRVFKLGP